MKTATAPITISITPDQKSLESGSFTGAEDGRRRTEGGIVGWAKPTGPAFGRPVDRLRVPTQLRANLSAYVALKSPSRRARFALPTLPTSVVCRPSSVLYSALMPPCLTTFSHLFISL